MYNKEVLIAIAVVIFVALIWFVYQRCRKERPEAYLQITFFLSPFKIKGTNMALTISTIQQATGQVNPIDRKGNPATVQPGSVDFSIADSSIATVEEDPNDETKFIVKGVAPGVTQLTVTADADLGDGVTTIETFAAIEVIPEGAVGFGITFSAPEDQAANNG